MQTQNDRCFSKIFLFCNKDEKIMDNELETNSIKSMSLK